MLRTLTSHWRVTGIFNARSGDRLNITSGVDQAFSGINIQRPDRVSDDFYANPRTVDDLLQPRGVRAAGPGALGNLTRNAVVGPAYWNIDMGISRRFSGSPSPRAARRSVQRAEPLQLGQPGDQLQLRQFGRITSLAGTPPNGVYGTMRILQFGIKYDF